jgi:hypothetical protein
MTKTAQHLERRVRRTVASIEVKKSDHGDSYGFQVTVKEKGGGTHHRVTLQRADYERLAGGKASP